MVIIIIPIISHSLSLSSCLSLSLSLPLIIINFYQTRELFLSLLLSLFLLDEKRKGGRVREKGESSERSLFSFGEEKGEKIESSFPLLYSLLSPFSFFTSLSFILSSFPFIFFILIIFFHSLHPHLFFFYSLKGRLSDFKGKEREENLINY